MLRPIFGQQNENLAFSFKNKTIGKEKQNENAKN